MKKRTYRLIKQFSLACAHQIPDADKCSRIHGHNYRVRFCLEGQELDEQGMLIDYRQIKRQLKQRYDHHFLNQFPEFDPEQGGIPPTTERVAEVFFEAIDTLCQQKETRPRVCWVEVQETDEAWVRVEEEVI